MTLLWEDGPQSARDIAITLNMRRKVAYTTVGTTLDRLYQRGILGHEAQGGVQGTLAWRYTPQLRRAAPVGRKSGADGRSSLTS